VRASQVTYLTDDPGKLYALEIGRADSQERLQKVLRRYDGLANDALAVVSAPEFDFAEWRRGLEMERQGKFAGEDFAMRYGAVMLPDKMLRASITAQQFKVPWGTAFIRLAELARSPEEKP